MKILKYFLKELIYLFKIYSNNFSGYNRGLIVLLYHSIPNELNLNDSKGISVHLELFKKQMNFLKTNNYNVISLKEGINYLKYKRTIPHKSVCITFDDGYEDNYFNACPVLQKYNFPATIFLISSYLENPGFFKHLKDKMNNYGKSLSLIQINKMKEKYKMIDFGCHSFNHFKLTQLDDISLFKEVVNAKIHLEANGVKTEIFAYPFGGIKTYNNKIIKLLKNLNFIAAFTSINGINYPGDDLFQLKRISTSWQDDILDFKIRLVGAEKWIKNLNLFLNN